MPPKFEETEAIEVEIPTFEATTPIDVQPTAPPEAQQAGIAVPPAVQTGAQILQLPIRAARAGAVGLERVTRGTGIIPTLVAPGQQPTTPQAIQVAAQAPEALQRAQEAFRPEFEPQPGREAAAAMTGEIAGTYALLAPLNRLAMRHPSVAGAITVGTLEAINQAANEGRIVPADIGKQAAVGASLPLVAPSAVALKNATKSVLKGAFKQTAKLPEQGLDALLENPNLLREFKGTIGAVKGRILNLQNALVKARSQAGNTLQKVKKSFGIDTPLEAPIIDRAPRNPEVLDKAFNQVQQLAQSKTADLKTKLSSLIDLRQEIDDVLSFAKPGQVVAPISGKVEAQLLNRRDQINKLIGKLSPRLRWAEKGYHQVAKTYDELQKALATPGKAEQMMVRLFKGEALDESLGTLSDTMKSLRKLEAVTKTKLVKPIMSELATNSFRKVAPHGFSGSILAGVAAVLALSQRPGLAAGVMAASSPRAVATMLPAAQKIGRGFQKIGQAISSPDGRAALNAILSQLNKPQQDLEQPQEPE